MSEMKGDYITVTINKSQYTAQEGECMLPVCLRSGVAIPHLCTEGSPYPQGTCNLCMVEVVTCGKRTMVPACTLIVQNGLEILTDTPEIIQHRTNLLERYLTDFPNSERIQRLSVEFGTPLGSIDRKITGTLHKKE